MLGKVVYLIDKLDITEPENVVVDPSLVKGSSSS